MFDHRNSLPERELAILKIRAKILQAARRWLDQTGYLEVQGPSLIPGVGDWSSYFEVKYYGTRAYLAQGLHPYADAFVEGLGKVYTVAPSFRVERVKTNRHLTEYWRIEVAQQCELDELIEAQEELLTHVCRCLATDAGEELKCLGHSDENLLKIKPPFPRLTYDECIEILQKDGFSILWGQGISWDLEKQLSMKFSQPFFVTELPEGIETLFHKSHPAKLGSTLTVDLLAPEGYGEIGGGGQIEDDKKGLRKKMAEEKIGAKERRWYARLRRLEMASNSGFVFGLERLIQWICKLEDISETTAMPRLADSIYP